jgi:hypothetical protein
MNQTKSEAERLQDMLNASDRLLNASRAENDVLRVKKRRADEALAAETGWRVPYMRQMNGLRAENERLRQRLVDAENAQADLDRIRQAENERLRGLIRTAHDNADYIVSMLKSESDAVTVWPQTWHAVMLVKAEDIMALEDEMLDRDKAR